MEIQLNYQRTIKSNESNKSNENSKFLKYLLKFTGLQFSRANCLRCRECEVQLRESARDNNICLHLPARIRCEDYNRHYDHLRLCWYASQFYFFHSLQINELFYSLFFFFLTQKSFIFVYLCFSFNIVMNLKF